MKMDKEKIEKIAKSLVGSNGLTGVVQDVGYQKGYLLYCEQYLGKSEQVDGLAVAIEDEFIQKYNAYSFPEGALFKCLVKQGGEVSIGFEFQEVTSDEIDALVLKHHITLKCDDRP